MINKKLTISVITVCKNAEKYIEETLLSVVNQKYSGNKFNLEYLIFDGNSVDNTNSIISKYAKKFPEIKHIIEEDEGLYDGLVKGFSQAKGDIISYINAGDFYYNGAFESVTNFFNSSNEINWITGAKVIYNEKSEIVKYMIPFKYRRNLIFKGVYGKNLPFIQQESTFWKKELLELVNYDYLKKLKKSGDMYLWHCFSKKFDLYTVDSYFSGFKFHENQLTFRETGNTDPYLKEASKFLSKKNYIDYFHIILDGIFWILSKYHSNILNVFNRNNLTYNIEEKQWILNKSNSKNYVAWACEMNRNQGEGKLGINFLSYLTKHKNISVHIKTIQNKIRISNGKLVYSYKEPYSSKTNLSFGEKYLSPFFGVIYLWYNFLRGRQTIYVNFLPLWNFLIFLLLPPKTILGPITGTTKINSPSSFERILRKYIMPYTFKISSYIINLRKMNTLFATENLKIIANNQLKNKKYYNFSLNEISSSYDNKSKPFNERKYDFCLYFRKHPNKNKDFFYKFISRFSENFPGKKMIIFGDEPEFESLENIEFFGLVDNKIILEYLNQTKFAIVSDETLFSFFMLDCVRNNVNIFYNDKDYNIDEKLMKIFSKVHPINFDNFELSTDKIQKVLNNVQNVPNYELKNINDFYSEYFLNL